MTENEIVNELRAGIANWENPTDLREALYQRALLWAHEEGAVDVSRYASDVTARIWAQVEIPTNNTKG